MISFIVTRFEGSIFGGEEQRAAERNELRDRTYDRPRDEVFCILYLVVLN